MSDTRDKRRGTTRVIPQIWGILAITATLLGSAAAQGSATVLKEDWDGISINSSYALTNTAGSAPGVVATGGARGNALRLTSLDLDINNSAAWDFVSYAGNQVVLSFLFSMTDDAANDAAGGCCEEAADGIGIGFFPTATYGTTGANNPAAPGGSRWEDPSFTSGFPGSMVIGLDVFDFGGPLGNRVRVAGPGGPTDVDYQGDAPFTLNDGRWHKLVASFVSNGDGGSSLSLQLIEDVDGLAIPHLLVLGAPVSGFDPNTFQGRLITGGRTGSAFVESLVDCVQIQSFGVGRPSFAKTFAPESVGPGSTSTLTFTIDNPLPVGVRDIEFGDFLPPGLQIADPPNIVNDCEGAVSATPGGNFIHLRGGRVPASGSCTLSVDVTAPEIGSYDNTTSLLLSDGGVAPPATATLSVVEELPGFRKNFDPPVVAPGQRSTLVFTIDNSANEGARRNLTFTDALPPGLVVADPPNIVEDCPGAAVTAAPGGSVISLTPDFADQPGLLEAFSTCEIRVDVVAAGPGLYKNVSGELTSNDSTGQNEASSGKANATLQVSATPLRITKRFLDDPTPPGGMVELEFTVTNRSREQSATGISFTDTLDANLTGLVAVGLPQNNVCGPGSQLAGTSTIALTGGSLEAGESCTFKVTLSVPESAPPGSYTNTTGAVSGTVDGQSEIGNTASDTLFVQPVPRLTKRFLDDPAIAGGSSRLEFTITNTSFSSPATDITFTDEFPSGIVSATNLPAADFCGAGSTITLIPGSQFDPPRLIVAGGTLAPDTSCTFTVLAQLDPGIASGIITNTTEPITATVGGQTLTGPPASADLRVVAAPQLSKYFDPPVVRPGQRTRLFFTLTQPAEANLSASEIKFTDDLGAMIPGMVAVGLPKNNICGAGSGVEGTSVITFGNGSLPAGGSCTFFVDVQIPRAAEQDTYNNTTSPVTAIVAGRAVNSGPASANLTVTALRLEKRFLEDFVAPGEKATLEFRITNSGSTPATDITFEDDLDGMIPGLRATDLPKNNICGAGSSIVQLGDGTIVFSGGTLAASTDCTFSVTVAIPVDTADDIYSNTTGELEATVGGATVTAPAAQADLEVTSLWLEITKAFNPSTAGPGQVIDLEFTITNLDPLLPMTGIAFSDALPPGLTAISPTQNNICGAGSQISGTNTIDFSGGSLPAAGSCTFSVQVQVSESAQPGELQNITSELTGRNPTVAVRGDPARATLTIAPPPPAGGSASIKGIARNPAGNTVLQLGTTPGVRYCIQWTEDFINWTDGPVLVGEEGPQQIVDSGLPDFPPPARQRFYRLVEKSLDP